MKASIRLSLLAAMMTAAFAAHAGDSDVFSPDDADITNTTAISNNVNVYGGATIAGKIDINGESGAVTNGVQKTLGTLSVNFGNADNNAKVGESVLDHAQGNIGLNVAAGAGNAQSNQAAIASVDGSDNVTRTVAGGNHMPPPHNSSAAVFANAQTFNEQVTLGSASLNLVGGDNNAEVTADLLSHASGNVGVNVAAGAGNAQGNSMAVASASTGPLAKASSSVEQLAALAGSGNVAIGCNDSDNNATLRGTIGYMASGNVGLNIAAGAGNAQANSLAIASAGTR